MMTLQNPSCKTEDAIDAYQREEKAMLMLSFKERPLKRADPRVLIGTLELTLLQLKMAIAARESHKVRHLLHEANVITARANIESVDLQTQDLL